MLAEKERLEGVALLVSGGETWPAVLFSAVDFFAVADLDDEDDELLVLNRIDNPIITFSDSIECSSPTSFFTPCGRGFSRSDLSRLTMRF